MDLSFAIAAAFASAAILRSDSRGTHDHILLSQIPNSPNLQGQIPVFLSPRDRVAQIYPQISLKCLLLYVNISARITYKTHVFSCYGRYLTTVSVYRVSA
jgi:hypothetical protein